MSPEKPQIPSWNEIGKIDWRKPKETPEEKNKRLVASIYAKRGLDNPKYTEEELNFIVEENKETERDRKATFGY